MLFIYRRAKLIKIFDRKKYFYPEIAYIFYNK